MPNINWKSIFLGALFSLLISLLLSIVCGIILFFAPLSELTVLPWSTTIIIIISSLLGGTFAAVRAGSKGLLHGVITALIFFLLAALLSVIITPESFALSSLGKKFILILGAGILGGIIGSAMKA